MRIILTGDVQVVKGKDPPSPVDMHHGPSNDNSEAGEATTEQNDQQTDSMKQCFHTLRSKVEEIVNADTRLTPFEMKLETMENSPLACKRLAREWVRESLGPDRKMVMLLPATNDGTQCSIELDVSFRTCPYRNSWMS